MSAFIGFYRYLLLFIYLKEIALLVSLAHKTRTSLINQVINVHLWSKSMIFLAGIATAMTATAATQHVVESGDTLSDLARYYDVSKTALIDTNGLQATHIQVGQVLDIPDKDAKHNIYKVQAGDSLTGVAKKFGIPLDDLAAANKLSPQSGLLIGSTLIISTKKSQKKARPITVARAIKVSSRGASDDDSRSAVAKPTIAVVNTKPSTKATRHRIAYGDSLSNIAKSYNVDIRALATANDMGLDDTLYFGRYLTIPAESGSVSAANNTRKVAKNAVRPSHYTVQRGDTLMGIANKFNTSFIQIAKLTNINYNDELAIGQKLVLPSNAVMSLLSP